MHPFWTLTSNIEYDLFNLITNQHNKEGGKKKSSFENLHNALIKCNEDSFKADYIVVVFFSIFLFKSFKRLEDAFRKENTKKLKKK